MLGFSGKVRKFNFVELDAESAAGSLRENPGPGAEIHFGFYAGANSENFGGGMQFQIRLNLN